LDKKTELSFDQRAESLTAGRRVRVLFVIPKPRENAGEAKPAAPPTQERE
jgi:hypothetical protein